ncbi:MAG: hypothetical protein JRD93_00785 [Deltaproteobacteria bacterium]|nr:hypothetical protein [Deltaproteobacteria bacterium]MBW2660537.1 hypothetical protein [Deltaproteobacteria bacterium]
MIKKKKPVFKLTCEYCKFYHLRICTAFGKQVKGSDPACNDFKKADAFWCNKNSYQILTVVCLNRQNHNCPGCVHCRQGQGIRSFMNQRQLALFDRFSS